jgi:biopolymer transport protein ExbB
MQFLPSVKRRPGRWSIALVALVLGTAGLAIHPQAIGQNSKETPSPAATDESTEPDGIDVDEAEQSTTIFEMVFGGNAFGVAIVCSIILLSIIATYFIIEHFITITQQRLIPKYVVDELERLIGDGEIRQAIQFCHQKENYSLVTDVVLAGLNRYQSSEFGFAEYRSAVEEAGEDFTGKLYRRTEVLHVIGSIAPMLGLLGTVLGMIDAFLTIASLDRMARPQELAGGIAQALVTTLQGLVVAIPAMVAYSYFRNKIDSIVSEAGNRIEIIMMPLGRKQRPSNK